MLLLGLRFVREPVKRSRVRPRLAAATLVLAAASAVLMAVLYQPGLDSIRVYDGTDTRAFGLLIGAALAMVWPSPAADAPDRDRAPGGCSTRAGLAGLRRDRADDLAHRLLHRRSSTAAASSCSRSRPRC